MSIIYRIQDKDGRGPYKPGFSKNWCDEEARCLIGAPMFPPYMEEFPEVQEKIDDIAERHGGAFGCGFRTKEQLHRWFTSEEIMKLFLFDYSIVEIEPDKVLAESQNQLVFWCKKPLAEIAKVIEPKFVHIFKKREPCDHEWNNEGVNPEYCLKCGMSLMAHAMMECP